jgi:DNA-directed RNA polymerase subunit L
MSRITDIVEDGNKLGFTIDGIDVTLANNLRRIMIDDIRGVAIHEVQISANTSYVPDEFYAHLLGMIAINVDPDMLSPYHEGDPYTEENSVDFLLEGICSVDRCQLLAANLKWLPKGNQIQKFGDKPPSVLFPKQGIAELINGQEVYMKLVCIAGSGTTKFRQVTHVYYEYEENNRNKFHFMVESIGVLSPKRIVREALDVFIARITRLIEEAKRTVLISQT